MRIILHVDMDSFYTSCEELSHPELKGKPLVVGADPKGGTGRGVVSTASYAARRFGVKSGMPISFAYRKCPECVFLPVDMEYYIRISEKVMQILVKHADKLEIGGVDEAFLDVSERCRSFKAAEALAQKIKDDVRTKLRLTCSVGVAPNRLIAKIASDFKKPDGLTVVTPQKAVDFLHPLEARKIPGIGPKTDAILQDMGIRTIGDLAKLSEKKLAEMFGKFGPTLYNYARSIDESEVIEGYEMKSIGREHTFQVDTNSVSDVEDILSELSAETHKQLMEEGKKFRTVTLKIRFTGFETHTAAATLAELTDDRQMILRTALHLLEKFLPLRKKVRLIGVRLSSLSGPETQSSLHSGLKG